MVDLIPMWPSYDDIITRIDEPPSYYTQQGVPRYGAFHPSAVTVYANAVSLYQVRCQAEMCGQLFEISYAWPTLFERLSLREEHGGLPNDIEDQAAVNAWHINIHKDINPHELVDLGDPPYHFYNDATCTGTTMSSITVALLEHWERGPLEAWSRKYLKHDSEDVPSF